MSSKAFPGLEFDFLRFIGVKAESQRRIQSFYLPWLEGYHKIVDLGCGDADLVGLLVERGADVVGVDADELAYQAALARGLPVVKGEALAYLRDLPCDSIDGIFSAHLVEHLPYPQVIGLVRESFRVLHPGGIIILATPNVRSLFSHLENFYLHFGHVSFYHPSLLRFFLSHEGFVNVQQGENPETASPLLDDLRRLPAICSETSRAELPREVHVPLQIPLQGPGWLNRISQRVKSVVGQWLVLPYLLDVVAQINTQVHQHERRLQQLQSSSQQQAYSLEAIKQALLRLDGAFECFALGYKP